MYDVSKESSGRLGERVFFSDLLGGALGRNFTGTIIVKTATAESRLLFEVGELLDLSGPLVDGAGAVETKIEKLMGLRIGSFHVKPGVLEGKPERPKKYDPWPVFLKTLLEHATDKELNAFSDSLLGKSVKISCGPAERVALAPPDEVKKLFDLIERARKPEHLEKFFKNRREVRGALKSLAAVNYLQILPAEEALAIPAAVRNPTGFGQRTQSSTTNQPPLRGATGGNIRKESAEVRALRKFYAEMNKLTYFQLLDIKQKSDPDPAELRRAYTMQAKKFHPDALGQDLADDVAVIARDVSAKLNQAYQVLNDAEKRGEYMLALESGFGHTDAADPTKAHAGKMKFDMGLVMLKKRNFAKARELFKTACEMDKMNGEFLGYMGWSYFMDPKYDRHKKFDTAYEYISQGIERAPKNAQLYYFLGQIYKFRNHKEDKDAARKAFQTSVNLDESHTESVRELRLLELRKKEDKKGKGKGKGGFLAKLFQRK